MNNVYDSTSLFQYLGFADIEKIQSQIIAWIFSPDCHAISIESRQNLLYELFGVNEPILNVQTEFENIDIAFFTEKTAIIIENKLKSSQHSNQLARYHANSESNRLLKQMEVSFFFLTLVSESSFNQKWKCISYRDIYTFLSSQEILVNSFDGHFLKEYITFLEKLTGAFQSFILKPSDFNFVFTDGHKKKIDKKQEDYKSHLDWFIASNQMETIFQRGFWISLLQKSNFSSYVVKETRGTALVDFNLIKNYKIGKHTFVMLLQIQSNTFKFVLAAEDYKKSKSDWITNLIPVMDELKNVNPFKYNRLNPPKEKAYISLSKKSDQVFWELSEEELIKRIQNELDNCKKLSEMLIVRITK